MGPSQNKIGVRLLGISSVFLKAARVAVHHLTLYCINATAFITNYLFNFKNIGVFYSERIFGNFSLFCSLEGKISLFRCFFILMVRPLENTLIKTTSRH
jgi:hypothetical protein